MKVWIAVIRHPEAGNVGCGVAATREEAVKAAEADAEVIVPDTREHWEYELDEWEKEVG